MTWTAFKDMHSGGGPKIENYEEICIEAPEKEAVSVFYSRFGRNPDDVSCNCCGEDFLYAEHETLEDVKHWHKPPKILMIRASEIKPEERTVQVPDPEYPDEDLTPGG